MSPIAYRHRYSIPCHLWEAHEAKELYMAEAEEATLELTPAWINQVEQKIGWLWTQQERAEREAVLRPIAAFLAKHDARLLELLNEGIRHLHEAFPESRGFKIVLDADREIPGWEYLVVSVKTSLPAEEAHARLNAFADAWLLDHMAQVDGTLLFDLEYE